MSPTWVKCHVRLNINHAFLLFPQLRLVSRPALPAPAVGIGALHQQQNEAVLTATFSSWDTGTTRAQDGRPWAPKWKLPPSTTSWSSSKTTWHFFSILEIQTEFRSVLCLFNLFHCRDSVWKLGYLFSFSPFKWSQNTSAKGLLSMWQIQVLFVVGMGLAL